MVNFAGKPVATYPIADSGLLRGRPGPGGAMDSRLKAAFVEFLRVRHGGSGYLFAFGSGAVGTPSVTASLPDNLQVAAERPFRSLSFPDINATVLRPACATPLGVLEPARDGHATACRSARAFRVGPGREEPLPLFGFRARSTPADSGSSPVPGPGPLRGHSPSNASEGGDPFVDVQTTDGNLGPLTGGRVNLVAIPSVQDVYLGSGARPIGGRARIFAPSGSRA